MKELRNRKSHQQKKVESKVEQRTLLRSSIGDFRCSTLGFYSNNPLVTEDIALDYYAGFLVRAALNKLKRGSDKKSRK